MERVVTVHGISSEGAWQEMVRFLLYPFYDCSSIKYKQYQRLGAVKLLLEPWWLAVSLVCIIVLRQRGLIRGTLRWCCALAVTFGIGHLLAYYRRTRAFKSFARQLNTSLIAGERPHLIAHSFGTYLTGRALRKLPALRFGSIILTGCVLSCRYSWKDLNARQRLAFFAVRNEMAMKDWVVRGAYLLQGLLPGMGHAGFRGFLGAPNVVHKTDSPFEPCVRCREGIPALVHNVEHPEFGHTDHFITSGHAESFWLPFLWKMEPSEYQEFLDLCYEAAELEEMRDSRKLAVVEAELRERPWRWASGTVSDYFRRRLSDALEDHSEGKIEDAVDRSCGLLWRSVRHAARVREKTFSVFLAASDVDKRTLDAQKLITSEEKDDLMALRPEFAALKVVRALEEDLRSDHAAQ